MPDQIGSNPIPKPPPSRDIQRVPPVTTRLLTQKNEVGIANKEAEKSVGKAKSKAEKIYEMHLRKLRSLAKPLDTSKTNESGERRFIEWASDERDLGIELMKDDFKWHGKVERVWVSPVRQRAQSFYLFFILTTAQETPAGKMMDLMISRSQIGRRPVPKALQKVGVIV